MLKRSVALFQIILLFSLTISTSEVVSAGASATLNPTGNLPRFQETVTGTGGEYQFFGSYPNGNTLWQDPTGKSLVLKSGELPPGASAPTGEFTWKGAFGGEAFGGGATGALTQGFLWGAALYLGVKMIGGMVGLGKETTDALANAVLVGKD